MFAVGAPPLSLASLSLSVGIRCFPVWRVKSFEFVFLRVICFGTSDMLRHIPFLVGCWRVASFCR